MLKPEMTKSEIERDLQGKGNFVQIDHLNRFLKDHPLSMDTKKFIFLKLASLYESSKLFGETAKAYDNAASISLTFAEKIKHYTKAAESYARLGAFDRIDEAMRKAMSEANSREPTESFLQLSDGPLTVARLLGGTRLHAAQVFVNACSSGAEEIDIGEEHVGLVTAFLQAGAASVLGALWQTFDLYGPDFAKEYYAAVDRGATRPQALRQAQLSFLTSGHHHLRDPIYWAPYFLSGC